MSLFTEPVEYNLVCHSSKHINALQHQDAVSRLPEIIMKYIIAKGDKMPVSLNIFLTNIYFAIKLSLCLKQV